MKHKRFEENILIDEAYTNYGKVDVNEDQKKSHGIAKHFAETLEYGERKKWFEQMPEEPSTFTKIPTQEQIEELKKEGNNALFGDTMAYETKQTRSGSSDHQWAKTLLNKGAIQDRVAAATILIQDNPLYNLTALKNLVNNVKPSKKKDGVTIIDALSELLISDLLIPNIKLRTFEQHALGHVDEMTSGNKQARRSLLKLWHFEDQLKELYGTYVESLNKFAQDSVESNREKAVSAMSYLLMHHPEREKMLLSNIINKLGDPSATVGSKVIYHLCQLLYNHPNMKAVVLADIEKMLFRSNIAPRAQYYGICFLNQFYLGKDDSRVAENLIRIYFSFFKACIKKGTIDTRLMSAILTGVKRAYPFADKDRLADTPAHVDAIHKLVHLAPLNTAIHALALLAQIQTESDRYFTALYRKLTSPDIFTTTHSALLFSLIYKSLSQDKDVARVAAFIKRLLQLAASSAPAQAAGLLLMISHTLKEERKQASLVHSKCIEIKDEKPKEEKKEENSDTENAAEESRTKQNDTLDSTEELKEEKKDEIKQEHKKIDLLHGDKKDLLLDDDEESYVDLDIDDQGNIKPERRLHKPAVKGWHHAAVTERKDDDKDVKELDKKIRLKKTINMDKVVCEYNHSTRNPSFAGALHTAYYELATLARHSHPTVRLFADKLLNEQLIQYSGDPLKDFSGIRFLDRFVFKNPKKRTERQDDIDGVRKVKGSHPKFAVRKNYTAKGIRSLPVNSASYLNEDVKKIPVDERFLYDFLQKRRSQPSDEDSDNDSVTSEDFDQYLDSFVGAKEAEVSEDELDYLADMEATKLKQPKKTKDEQLDDDDDDEAGDLAAGDDDEASDGELNISGDEDEPQLSDDEDEMLLQGSDDDDEDDGLMGKNKIKLKGGDDLSSLFASAEEFSTLLEETATNTKQGSSQAVSNTDNSSKKQLAWEEKRDKWIKGYKKNIYGKNSKRVHKKFDKSGNTNKMAGNTNSGKTGKRKFGNADKVGGKKRKFK